MKSIYENLSDQKFTKLKLELVKLEEKIIPFCNENMISLDRERFYSEGLGINLHKQGKELNYHSSLFYLNNKGIARFSFGILMSYDTEKGRFYKKETLAEEKPLEYFDKNIIDLLKKSIDLYNSWHKSDLKEYIEFTSPPNY